MNSFKIHKEIPRYKVVAGCRKKKSETLLSQITIFVSFPLPVTK